jgi:hypothetical protein
MKKTFISLLAIVSLATPLTFATPIFAETMIDLSPAFSTLGVSCGGIHKSSYVTGFDADGNITGKVYAWTRCGSSGRGGGYTTKTYSSWNGVVWNLATGAALKSFPYDGIKPDPAFTATDAQGNRIFTKSYYTSYGTAYMGQLVKP